MISDSIKDRLLRLAEKASRKSDFESHKLSSIVFYKNKILCVGWNTCKGNNMQRHYNEFRFDQLKSDGRNPAHAEIKALCKYKHSKFFLNSKYDPKDLKLFVFRQNKHCDLACAKPCISCYMAIKDFGIKNVYYTDNNGDISYLQIS